MGVLAYGEALKLRPKDGEALVGRANARLWLGDHAGAMADYDAALAIDPADALALFDRALENRSQGRREAALADYEALLRVSPPAADAAAAWRERTVAATTEALRLDPRAAWALKRRGRVYLEADRAADALRDFAAALAIDAAARDGRARAAAALGSTAPAP